jgi:UDP-N-acetylglucosamine acyltransferase
MIHPTAVIEKGAELGVGVDVGPFAYIDRDTRIGDGCVLNAHATVLRHTTLGRNCRVHSGAVLGDLPQDKAFKEAPSFVTIGDGCVLREGVTVHRGTKEGTVTELGPNGLFMANSHFAHNVRIGKNVIVANGALLGGYVQVGDNAFISGNVMIHQFCRIGTLAMLGGGAGVSKDIPPFCLVRPVAMNRVLGLNIVGLRRAGFTPEQRGEIHEAFHVLYQSGRNVSQAVEEMKRLFPAGPAMELWTFIETSQRGICGLERGGNGPDA